MKNKTPYHIKESDKVLYLGTFPEVLGFKEANPSDKEPVEKQQVGGDCENILSQSSRPVTQEKLAT